MAKVTIGVPLCNSTPYIEETLRSVISQRYADIEILVSDDASTDQTLARVRELAREDGRIRVFTHPERLGWVKNYNFLAAQATGEFFCWMAHDDVLHRDFIGRLVGLLERHPDAVLAYAEILRMDEGGALGRRWTGSRYMSRSASRLRRALRYLWWTEWEKSVPFHGVMRAEALRRTGGLPEIRFAADDVFLFALSLVGRFVFEPDALFRKRMHHDSTSASLGYSAPEWAEYFRALEASVRATELGRSESALLVGSVRLRARGARLAGGVLGAANQAVFARRGPLRVADRLLRTAALKLISR
jgi:GT2 family glycosyltransferase